MMQNSQFLDLDDAMSSDTFANECKDDMLYIFPDVA
jgi:hypothetical protein